VVYRARLRIGTQEVKLLAEGIAKEQVRIAEPVRIAAVMAATLTSGEHSFRIKSLNEREQTVLNPYAESAWDIEPLDGDVTN
jgi:hypothetical protein